MFDWLNNVPPEYCCLMLPRIVWPMIFADSIIALSYFAIGGWLLWATATGSAYGRVIQSGRFLLGMFILLCGTGHLIGVVKIWIPVCDTMVFVQLATAGVSLATAVWAWINRALISRMFALKGFTK